MRENRKRGAPTRSGVQASKQTGRRTVYAALLLSFAIISDLTVLLLRLAFFDRRVFLGGEHDFCFLVFVAEFRERGRTSGAAEMRTVAADDDGFAVFGLVIFDFFTGDRAGPNIDDFDSLAVFFGWTGEHGGRGEYRQCREQNE